MIDKQAFHNQVADFEALKIKLASPEEIRSWSHGEVTKSETINYRTLKPEKDGLFCERTFGPTRDWECYCGKYKHRRYEGVICDKCGVEVTRSRVRRERMGHINLAAACGHVWYFKGSVSPLSILLGVSNKYLQRVIYFTNYLIIDVDEQKRKTVLSNLGRDYKNEIEKIRLNQKQKVKEIKILAQKETAELKKRLKDKETQELALAELELQTKRKIQQTQLEQEKQEKTVDQLYQFLERKVKLMAFLDFLSEDEYFTLRDHQAGDFFSAQMGAEALVESIKKLDLKKTITSLRKETEQTRSKTKLRKLYQRITLIGDLLESGVDPAWMILNILPVLPPDLRPMVQLTGGKFATSDLNDLYRRVINRNNRLNNLIDIGAPEIILRNEKRMLQEAVDNLIDSSQIRRRQASSRRELRSLSEMLKGKKGRFRQNLLGKRVDYSGRSVIIVGPKLRLNQCGLPKEIALEMFKPYVLHEMIIKGLAPNIRSAKVVLEQRPPEIYDVLAKVVKDKVVLLNRAPTLHKLSLQAFYPVLVDGLAIQLHPCVCSGFNADFDGDQMAVHLPLSEEAQKEAASQMTPSSNLLKPADGSPVSIPSRKEMALGIYYLTTIDPEAKSFGSVLDIQESLSACQRGYLDLRQPVVIWHQGERIETSVGRIIFNQILPDNIGFVNENVDSTLLRNIFDRLLGDKDQAMVVEMIDQVKDLGFWAGTLSGLSVGVNDNLLYPNKDKIIAQAEKRVLEVDQSFEQGLITKQEKERLTQQIWIETTEELADKTWELFDETSPVKLIIDAKVSRASRDQVKQLSAMRGLLVDPMGNIVPMPTKSNFREGLSVFEYITSARGSRKGLTDTALKTADAGYLTRRLVDAAHDMLVREGDCGTKKGIIISREGVRGDKFESRILGRVLAQAIRKGRKTLLKRGEIIDDQKLALIVKEKVTQVMVRSALTCQTPYGVCSNCYGWDFSNRKIASIGTPVGVLAAQSIGEPGTQLTMRTKHSGGVIGVDVTQGLPRVEELFESRTPKSMSPIAEIDGVVSIKEKDGGYLVTVANKEDSREYYVLGILELRVKNGEKVLTGAQLASGALDIEDVLKIRGREEAQHYLLAEIQGVYESQGININDRHFEVMVRKMSSKIHILSAGDTDMIIDSDIDREVFEAENKKARDNNKKPARGKRIILGISRTALTTNSWLSAASFQTTTNVLTHASLKGKIDPLIGLKENVIIGRLIPTSPDRVKTNEDWLDF
ncbi:MAG: DNA-directed RNA polymerase subunit beta' [Candidatus Shapirobacteria bacterium]|nr:DNA-directed RNA polymerase subunit beta' [Candidatus Shapirobacteria bacterium]